MQKPIACCKDRNKTYKISHAPMQRLLLAVLYMQRECEQQQM